MRRSDSVPAVGVRGCSVRSPRPAAARSPSSSASSSRRRRKSTEAELPRRTSSSRAAARRRTNLLFAAVWASLLRVPFPRLVPAIVAVGAVGVYGVQNAVFDVWPMLAFGAFGWALRRAGLEPTPPVLGFVLGPGLEEHLRRALLISRGDPTAPVADPVGGACAALLVALLWWRAAGAVGRRRA
jgi:hypothetical protein